MRLHHVRFDPGFQLIEVEAGVLAGARWQGHGEPEDRDLPGDIMQAAYHVPLAGDRDHRLGSPLADHPPGELPSGRHEDWHIVLPRDREDAIQ